nr:hypothetical protein [Mycoplasmopsis bovis]
MLLKEKLNQKLLRLIKLEEVADIFEKLQKGEFLGRAVIDFRK